MKLVKNLKNIRRLILLLVSILRLSFYWPLISKIEFIRVHYNSRRKRSLKTPEDCIILKIYSLMIFSSYWTTLEISAPRFLRKIYLQCPSLLVLNLKIRIFILFFQLLSNSNSILNFLNLNFVKIN